MIISNQVQAIEGTQLLREQVVTMIGREREELQAIKKPTVICRLSTF